MNDPAVMTCPCPLVARGMRRSGRAAAIRRAYDNRYGIAHAAIALVI